jgi:hypothetical protein
MDVPAVDNLSQIHPQEEKEKETQPTQGLGLIVNASPTGAAEAYLSPLSTPPTTVTNPYKYIYNS